MAKPVKATRSPSSGKLSRGAIAGMAVARVGLSHLSHKAQGLTRPDEQAAQAKVEHEAELGRILFAALNQLKGTALKASQLLSMELGFLPEGIRCELAKAHYQVTPLNRALVIKLLRQEFGAGPDSLFQTFESLAFAAASLGQVHAATLADGQAVAVKLQYPGMAASIGSDLALLRTLLGAINLRTYTLPKADIVAPVMADIERKLAEELDYLHEAEQLVWFGQHLTRTDWVVPQPVPHLTSRRVLTMQRLTGLHLNEWLQTRPSQAERNHFGQLLFDLFMRCLFDLRRLQADPHPGNYLFMPDGRLGLLDFGCTRSLSADFCDALGTAWSAQLRQPRDAAQMQRAYLRLGLIAPTLSEHDFRTQLMPALADLHAWQGLPFAVDVYDFSQLPPMPRMSATQHRGALQHLHGMPPDMPYFDRAHLGLTQLLRTLGARVRTSNPWIHQEHPQACCAPGAANPGLWQR
ncbi:MAG: AarF/ABC1/UbiB kinase family protein [Rhodoferax sp.]|nr:AarF/ABC1/UbiB kinase family protein [Rhodoferax sp.]